MLLFSLILSHLLGDFILQPKSWVEAKEKEGAKGPYLYLHVLIHVLLFLLIVSSEYLWMLPFIAISHFCIDLIKTKKQTEATKKQWFFIDQGLHILVLVALVNFSQYPILASLNWNFWIPVLTGGVFVTLPCAIIVRYLIADFTAQVPQEGKWDVDSLANAGTYIGILERLLVYLFIVTQHWEGVGFMIAAKSVFRFSDLAESRQRKLTEYVLIGTLLSFGLAVVTGILVVSVFNIE